MSAPVDVRAALGRLMPGPYSSESELLAVRAAIAELVNASRDAAAVLQSKAGPMEQETPRRLYAALRAVGGAE